MTLRRLGAGLLTACALLAGCVEEPIDTGTPQWDPADLAACLLLDPLDVDFGIVSTRASEDERTRTVELLNRCDHEVQAPDLWLADRQNGWEEDDAFVRTPLSTDFLLPGESATFDVTLKTEVPGVYWRSLTSRGSQTLNLHGRFLAELREASLARQEVAPERFPLGPGCGTSLNLSLVLDGDEAVTVDNVILNGHPDWSVETPAILDALPAVIQPGSPPLEFTLRLAPEAQATGPRSVEFLVLTEGATVRRYLYRGAAWPEEGVARVRYGNPNNAGGPVAVQLAQRPDPATLDAIYIVSRAPFTYDAEDNIVYVDTNTAPGSMVEVRYLPACE